MINLKQEYGHLYRVVDDGTDDSNREERVSCQEIPGKYGKIYFYGGDKLAVCCTSIRIATKLDQMGLQAIQRGDEEVVFLFKKDMLGQIAALVRSSKRRRYSFEATAKHIEALGRWRRTKRSQIS